MQSAVTRWTGIHAVGSGSQLLLVPNAVAHFITIGCSFADRLGQQTWWGRRPAGLESSNMQVSYEQISCGMTVLFDM